MKPIGNRELSDIKTTIDAMPPSETRTKMHRLLSWVTTLEKYVAVRLTEDEELLIARVVEKR